MKTRVLTKADVEQLATAELAVNAVEHAFAEFARHRASMPPKVYLSIEDHDGDFRAMPSRLGDAAGIKWVNVHPRNLERGLPSVMGVFILSDPASGFPLAVMDATLLTALRTGAAGAVASRYLASSAPNTVSFVGAGVQARTLYAAHRVVFPFFDPLIHDRDEAAATRLSREIGGRVVSLEEAAGADIVCTATPSRTPLLESSWIRTGAHINAMGADAPGKQELDAAILDDAAVYIDEVHQATASGEINVPIQEGRFSVDDIAGSLGEVVVGWLTRPEPGRTTVFDSTGLAVQDVALASALHEAATATGVGFEIDLVGVEPLS